MTTSNHFLERFLHRPARSRERPPPRKELVQHHADRVDVATTVYALGRISKGLEMLWRHVGQGSTKFGGCRSSNTLGVRGQIEIEQHRPLVSQQDIGRLEIAMDNAAFVSVGQRIRNAFPNPYNRLYVGHLSELTQH